jgi:hypothetical protein
MRPYDDTMLALALVRACSSAERALFCRNP